MFQMNLFLNFYNIIENTRVLLDYESGHKQLAQNMCVEMILSCFLFNWKGSQE